MDSTAKIRFLSTPECQGLLEQLGKDNRDDLALSQSALLKGYPVSQRAALLEQRALRRKARLKQEKGESMLLTPLGLMQMTHATLAQSKVARALEAGVTSVVDYCCGLGGDSFYWPEHIPVIGVDKDEAVLGAYRHNVKLYRSARAVLADALASPVKADFAMIDPARRAMASEGNWGADQLSPGLDALLQIVKKHRAAAIKLGPGLKLPIEFHEVGTVEYLGLKDACLECTVWTGEMGSPGLVRASEYPSGASLQAYRDDIEDAFSSCGDEEDPGFGDLENAWIYEPVKCAVRAQLYGVLALKLGLHCVDPGIAYLWSRERIESPFLKAYRVVKELPFDEKVWKATFKAADVGILAIKKRGITVVPETLRPRIVGRGPQAATLILVKWRGKKRAFWTLAAQDQAENDSDDMHDDSA